MAEMLGNADLVNTEIDMYNAVTATDMDAAASVVQKPVFHHVLRQIIVMTTKMINRTAAPDLQIPETVSLEPTGS